MSKCADFAFDRSARRFDEDGRLHVAVSHISKAMVSPYYGKEIPNYIELGLDPDRVYQLLRDPAELERGAPTFANLPILSKHVPVTVDAPQPDLVIGSIGSDVTFNPPYLDASLCFWDAAAIAGIETEQWAELSCAYRYDADMTPGEYEGVSYDGRMTNIRGNHLALVEVGRAGPDVVVADHNPFAKERPAMKMSALGLALFGALRAASPKLAQDSALPELVGRAQRKTLDKKALVGKLMAADAELDAERLDDIIDAILGVEQEPEPIEPPKAAEDEEETAPKSVRERVIEALRGKVDDATLESVGAMLAEDADDEPADKVDLEAAMDSFRVELRQLEQAKDDVRAVVGSVTGMDNAEQVYRFALDHMAVDHKDVAGAAALRAVFRVASAKTATKAPSVAADSAGVLKQFPGLARIGRV